MTLIKQYSRISHHTLTTTGTTNFTVPPTEDFTDGSWSVTDLAKSEFGIAEGTDRLFIRIDDDIFQIPLSTATGATLAELWSGGTGTNTVFVSGSMPINTSGDNSIIGGLGSYMSGDRSIIGGLSNSGLTNDNLITGRFNTINGKTGFVAGQNNIVIGSVGAVFGDGNTLNNFATNSIILGGTGITGSTANTAYVPNLNINSTPSSGTTEDKILVRDSSGTVKQINNVYNYGFYSQTGNSTTVSATTTETSIVGAGVGTLTVPANGFQVGDSFHGKIGGYVSSANNAELTIRIKTSGTTLFTIGPIILPSMTNQFWENEIDFTVRNIGASGTLQTNGQFVYIQNSGNNYNGYGFNTNTTLDTTIDNTLDITVEWDTTNASNAIMSDIFYLKKVY